MTIVGVGYWLVVDEDGDFVKWLRADGAVGIDYQDDDRVLWLLPDGSTAVEDATDAQLDLCDAFNRLHREPGARRDEGAVPGRGLKSGRWTPVRLSGVGLVVYRGPKGKLVAVLAAKLGTANYGPRRR
jgi:hypothetical protein